MKTTLNLLVLYSALVLGLSSTPLRTSSYGKRTLHSGGNQLGASSKGRLALRSSEVDASRLCGLSSDRVLSVNPQVFGETAESLQASWVGKDRLVIVASDKKRSTVWQGHVLAHGVFRFNKDDSLIGEAVYPLSLRVSPVDPEMATIVTLSRQHMYTSSDAGHSWRRVKLPTDNFTPESDIFMSLLRKMVLALLSTAGELFITDDFGMTWSLVAKGAKSLSFTSGPTHPSVEYMYYSVGSQEPSFNPLFRYNMVTRRSEALDNRAFKFTVDGRYLYVSRQNYTGKSEDALSRRLYVSNTFDAPDVSSVHFTEVQLPSLKPEELFVVMATHEAGSFIHVSDSIGDSSGSLYMSDSSGVRFSLSLSNNLYHMMDFGTAVMSVDDFYEVKSSRGVYITTTVVPSGHVSMITYNSGGSWQKIRAPEGNGCALPLCSLHIHIRFSQLVGPFYNIPSLASPLSVSSANGIIIAHGSLGAVRNDSAPRLYISVDGGYSWRDSGLPPGSYVYGIADYGNVLAVVPNSDVVEHIWFSHDLGRCFRREVLDSSSVFRLARGLMVDPSAASLFAFVLGVEGLGTADMWRMVTINFGSLLNSKCQEADYENVTDPICLLGYKDVYNVTKSSSICFNEEGYSSAPIARTSCLCTSQDLECDYDFFYNGSACTRLGGGVSLASVCAPELTSYYESISGYRLITGDQCVQTDDIKDLIMQVKKPCTAHELGAGFLALHRRADRVVVGIILVVVIVAAAVLSLFVFVRCYRTKLVVKEQVRYKRVPLTDHYSDEEDSLPTIA